MGACNAQRQASWPSRSAARVCDAACVWSLLWSGAPHSDNHPAIGDGPGPKGFEARLCAETPFGALVLPSRVPPSVRQSSLTRPASAISCATMARCGDSDADTFAASSGSARLALEAWRARKGATYPRAAGHGRCAPNDGLCRKAQAWEGGVMYGTQPKRVILCTCQNGACPSCNGSGRRPCTPETGHRGAWCPFCHGTGWCTRSWCHGTGRHMACGGTGYLPRVQAGRSHQDVLAVPGLPGAGWPEVRRRAPWPHTRQP